MPRRLYCLGGYQLDGAPAEGIEHDIALVQARTDDALQQCQRLLGRVAATFLGRVVDPVNVGPNVSDTS